MDDASQVSERPADKILSMLRAQREKKLVIQEGAMIMDTAEERAESYLSTEDLSAQVFGGLISKELQRQNNLKDADKSDNDSMLCDPYNQPEDVFERKWTLASPEHPVWLKLCKIVKDLADKCQKNKQQMAACSSCMTIFTPCFPGDHHLHSPCEEFKKAIRRKRRSAGQMQELAGTEPSDQLELDVSLALVKLAHSASAYKKEESCEYIKMPRIVEGKRSRELKGKFDYSEFCQNCDVGIDLPGESKKRLADEMHHEGILFLINVYYVLTKGSIDVGPCQLSSLRKTNPVLALWVSFRASLVRLKSLRTARYASELSCSPSGTTCV
jgi:hypothetical protein